MKLSVSKEGHHINSFLMDTRAAHKREHFFMFSTSYHYKRYDNIMQARKAVDDGRRRASAKRQWTWKSVISDATIFAWGQQCPAVQASNHLLLMK
jgi:hypothetical protein